MENYRNYAIKIVQDVSPESPREWDNFGMMVCWHRSYVLGDKNAFRELDDAIAFFNETDAVILPIYMYDHSWITISTKPFSCPWDSGQVGFIYVTKEKIIKEFGAYNADTIAKANDCLRAEVNTYDQYLTGDVYGFVVEDPKGEEVHSCWGFYGSEYCMEEAKSVVDADIKEKLAERVKKLKTLVRNKVPFDRRERALA